MDMSWIPSPLTCIAVLGYFILNLALNYCALPPLDARAMGQWRRRAQCGAHGIRPRAPVPALAARARALTGGRRFDSFSRR